MAEELRRLIEAELESATFIPLRDALTPHFVEPFVRRLKWPWSEPPREILCWVFADLSFHRSGLGLAYVSPDQGGYGAPWGIIHSDNEWIDGDYAWFAYLEDAFINSGAWKGPLPSGYEVR